MLFHISADKTSAWGFYAHKQINRIAIFTLPPDLFGFYKLHIEFITEHSVNADKRRYAVKEEACRHYLDADHYEQALPFDTIPPFWKDAVAKISEDTLNAYGIVPWYIQLMRVRLVVAFKEKDVKKILKLSSDIGHYIADLHVPLHSTENYDGQLTGQSGIHALWESRLPELYSENYDFFVGRAVFLPDLNAAVWLAFGESFAARDSVLSFEKRMSIKMSPEMKYSLENKGNMQTKQFSKEFCDDYHSSLGGMVERRMRASMLMVGSVWLTAWVDAGQPKLDGIEERQLDDAERQAKIKEELEFLKGKIIGRDEAR
jgi:hypothetical protein